MRFGVWSVEHRVDSVQRTALDLVLVGEGARAFCHGPDRYSPLGSTRKHLPVVRPDLRTKPAITLSKRELTQIKNVAEENSQGYSSHLVRKQIGGECFW